MTAFHPMSGALAPQPSTAGVIVNFVVFQAGWFACVAGAAHGWPWAGTAATAAIVAWHTARAASPAQELKLMAVAVLIGALWDSALTSLGWLAFASGTLVDGAAPHWILAMWALLATTLNVSLNWLKNRWLVSALLGAVCGPLAYWAGARLGAVVLVDPLHALIALSIGWAVMMPMLLMLASRYDGMHAAHTAKNRGSTS